MVLKSYIGIVSTVEEKQKKFLQDTLYCSMNFLCMVLPSFNAEFSVSGLSLLFCLNKEQLSQAAGFVYSGEQTAAAMGGCNIWFGKRRRC
jgi:hypothetical protein